MIEKDELDMAKEKGTAWYRSKKRIPINFPFVGDGYLSNKRWPLIEGSKAQSIVLCSLNIDFRFCLSTS